MGQWIARVGIGLVVLSLVLPAVLWFVVAPHWRPGLAPGQTYGVDVSHHQGTIDWAAVATDDIRFAYIKATEGGDFGDRQFTTNWTAARESGLERGAYHFFTLCRPGIEQAAWFLEVARPDPDALPPAVDLELAGNCSARPSVAEVGRELNDFLDAVESAWRMPTVLYVGHDWETTYPITRVTDRPLWLRRTLARPDPDGWVIWQLHGNADIQGISGRADINVGDLDRLLTIAGR